ncbi:MAG TPA: glycosyltransferase [Bacteroidales bacterium]
METIKMDTFIPTDSEILCELKKVVNTIPVEIGQESSLAKTYLMAYLAVKYNIQNYVQIGVDRSKNFLLMAHIAKFTGFMAFGVDSFNHETAQKENLGEAVDQMRKNSIASVDYPSTYEYVNQLRKELDISNNSEIIKEEPDSAIDYFREGKITIDLLYVGGNGTADQLLKSIELYLPLVKMAGFIVIDNIDLDLIKPAYNKLEKACDTLYSNETFTILFKGYPDKKIAFLEKPRLNVLYNMVENTEKNVGIVVTDNGTIGGTNLTDNTKLPKVSVVVTTYNQEKYIAECLEGILAQKGDFRIELVIGNDFSTDESGNVIQVFVDFIKNNKNFEVKILPTDHNYGMISNLKRCLKVCTGDYFAICEGDDYWIDVYKLQKQINFLKFHPGCALCFNDIYFFYQETEAITEENRLKVDIITTGELILDNSIGNFSRFLYDAQYLHKIPDDLYNLTIADWMFNIYYSQFGDIGRVNEVMSVYRVHKGGLWSGLSRSENVNQLHAYIDDYNRFTNYKYDAEFSLCQMRLESTDEYKEPSDIVVIDDFFPDPLSAFRWQEFICYLQEFKNLIIYTTGETIKYFDTVSLDDLMADFKRKFPEHAHQLKRFDPAQYPHVIKNTKLIYSDFLINAAFSIIIAEKLQVPFVFTLYPGGGFHLNIADSDAMLKRITSSPCFRKVIVTQKVTYDYLINNHYCTPDQIEFIFGVVTPLKKNDAEDIAKKYFRIDKKILDICFVAYKYTAKGVDKGYDIFIDVARQLSKKYDDIQFHVVGGIDENDIDVSDLKGRITFYGKQKLEWFDDFYKDKDIILSPNIPGKMYEGSFDGFPTGSCVDAGLRKTAIFCTDELGLNTKAFSNGDEIVIIPHNAESITRTIEGYYHDPEKLKSISERGSLKIKQLYSFEAQILPRISLLKKEVELAERSIIAISEKMNDPSYKKNIHSENNEKSIIKDIFLSVKLLAGRNPRLIVANLKKMKNSKTFGRIRGVFVPPSSTRARVLRRIYNNSVLHFREFLKNRKDMRDLALIRSSELFDKVWYLANNPDVVQANMDPALHYWRYGGTEGRDPGPNFHSKGYLDAYADVKKARINPLLHYLKYGKKEGRISTQGQQIEIADFPFSCPVCGEKVKEFVPLSSYYEENWKKYHFPYKSDDFETLNSKQYHCPNCGASDRERLYALYLTGIMKKDLSGNPITILDIAPAIPLKMFLLKYSNIKYQSTDRYMKDVDFVVDITNMNTIDQEVYNFFICSHVLEHVTDDHKALSELFRILKPGGSGILMVPVNLRIDMIMEDPTVSDIGERWRRFGQDDHIRLYSKKGFIERVEQAGFTINQYGVDYFGEEAFFQHGISSKSILYIAEKK